MNNIDKKKIWIFLRVGVIVCLILCLFNIKIKKKDNKNCTLFLVDRSLSVANYEEDIENYINNQIENKHTKDKVGVVSFGKDCMVDMPITNDIEKFKFTTDIDSIFTNIEKGINFALNYFPEKCNKKLVVFTDCVENLGSYKNIIQEAKEQNVNIYIYPLKSKYENDSQLKTIKVPSYVYRGEDIPVDVNIYSNFKTKGVFYLYNHKDKIIEKEININKGENNFKYLMPLNENTNKTLKGEIKVEGDNNPYNDFFTTEIQKEHTPRVLVIGQEDDRKNIENLLKSLNIEVTLYTQKEVPTSLNFLTSYNEIILINTSHNELSKELEKNISYCVKEQGIGLLVVGGDKTFALGNYRQTFLEKMLPVTSDIKDNEKKPNTGIILAIDSSGSMNDKSGGVKKIEMAKEAAISSIEVLNKDDCVGIVGFSDTVEWIVPYGKVKDKQKIIKNIGKLKAKGGTLILPSLQKSLDALINSDTKINHIILMTDGQGEKTGYEDIINKLSIKGITLSTIGVGKDSDKSFLQNLSEQCRGRNYFVDEAINIPKIFAKETYIATRKYINEREFIPQLSSKTSLFKTNSFPKLTGYISTSLKQGGNLILKTDLDEPLLADWNYGIGKVMVWTSDLNGKWSNYWIKSNDFQNIWKNIIDYLLSQGNTEEDYIELSQNGTSLEAIVNTNGLGKKVQMTVLNSNKKSLKYNMNQIQKGKFKQKIYLDKIGSYIINFKVEKDNKICDKYSRVIYLNYSPEYDVVKMDHSTRLEFLNNFNLINNKTLVFDIPMINRNYSSVKVDFILLPLALLLFILDLFVREKLGGNKN